MCGIAGSIGSGPPEARSRAMAGIAHRGPDDSGEFVDDAAGVWLGHTRLAILDLSPLGHQPMTSGDGRLTVVFNGEIYNYRELRAELEASGHRFRGTSDTEVLLKLLETGGVETLSKLKGIFAFGLWDRIDRSLLVARDQLGVKPLYYANEGSRFAFASELKALLPLWPAARNLDVASLHRYLSFLWSPGDGTPLLGVKKVLPGEAMIVRQGQPVTRWIWYQLPVFRARQPELLEAEAVRGTADCLRTAVHRQLVADVPVGAFLSGGLDSSAVVAFAREEVPDLRCFTIDCGLADEAGMTDDLPYARRVAKHLDVPLEVVTVDAGRIASNIEQMIAQLDEPLADPAPLSVLYIARLAREQGRKVLLSGAGGDDLFTGYRRHLALMYERYWRWLPQGIRRALEQTTQRLDQRNPILRRLTRVFSGAGLSGDSSIVNYFLWVREQQLFELYSPAFRAELGPATAQAPLLEFLSRLPLSVPPLERLLALEQRFFLADHNLAYTDKMSMAVGVEVRVPFLDLDLVEHAARIPGSLKQRGRTSKWVLKKAMEPYLPHDVIYRPKSGFGAPMRRWMRHELRPLLGDLLSEQSVRRRGLFDPGAIRQLIARNDSGQVDAAYTLLSLLCIEIWCRAYVDAPAPASRPAFAPLAARQQA